MELKTIKEFCHKNNLGEGLEYKNGKFQVNIDNELNTIATALTDLNENKANKDDLSTLYKVKGSSTVANINVMTPEVGWVYNLTDSGTIINGLTGEVPVDAGDNVVYTDSGWDKLSAATKIALEAGNNISIEGNIISAVGYTYDAEKNSFSIGTGTATGEGSYAEGNKTTASGPYSRAEGVLTKAEGHASHAEGTSTKAGRTAHAEGGSTEATGNYSHSEGYQTKAFGESSHAEGSISEALGSDSHAEGFRTMANNKYEHAQGCHNISNKNSDEFGDAGNTIHSIGIGSWTERKNAQEVMQNGDYYVIGVGDYDGTTIEGASSVQSVINTLINTDIPAINQRIDNLNIPTLPENIVNTINGQTGVVTIDIPTLPNNIVNTVNGQSGDVTIPISNLATKEELATEVNNLNTAINNITHPEDLVKSVNGKTGNVTIGINDISGLSSQLNTFITESEVDNKINNINIDFSDNSGIGINPTNGLTVKLSNGGTAKINKNGIQVFDSTGLEKIKLVDKDININDSEFTPTVVTKNIKNVNTVINLTSAPTEVKKYTMFIDNSTNTEFQYQATSTNNDCNIGIGGNLYFTIDGGNSNETEYYNVGIGVFDSNNKLIKTLSNLAIKITKSQTGSETYSRTGYYYCKGTEVTESNQNTLTWETSANGIAQDLSTSTWYCCSTNLQKLGIYVYAIKPSYSATSCTVTYIPQGFTGYCKVNNYNPQKTVIGINGILNYKTNRNYFGAYTENNQFKIIGKGDVVNIQQNG